MNKEWVAASRQIQQGQVSPVYLVISDDSWTRDKLVGLLKHTLVDPSMADFNFERAHAGEISGVAVADKARELPMMADKRLIVIDACEQWKSRDLEGVSAYFSAINEQTCLVLLFQTADLRKKIFKFKSPLVKRLSFQKPKRWEWETYIKAMAAEMKVRITDEAIRMVAELAGDELSTVSRELEKLSLYKLDSGPVNAEDVEALMGRTRHVTRWELSAFIGKRDLKGSLMKMHDILDSGEEPIGMLSTVYLHLRQLLAIKALWMRGVKDERAVGDMLRVPPRIARDLIRQQENFTGFELRKAFHLLRDTDLRLKSAAMDRRLIMDHLITQIVVRGPLSPGVGTRH